MSNIESKPVVRVLSRKNNVKDEEGNAYNPPKKKRVAVYCRVSTELESQEGSLQVQKESFLQKIMEHWDWELANVYADEGVSGTQILRREAFNRMIEDCENGKIDYILTKSISRFARNTLECLSYVRILKEKGIYIYFEKEKLDTGNAASEMILSILAAVAQEESRNISENIKWSQQKRFSEGLPKWSKTYGYEKANGQLFVINEAQAKIVRFIFDKYMRGNSITQIAAMLEKEGIPSPKGGHWQKKVISGILANEKYVGDVMLQKSRTIDHLTHKRVRNDRMEIPSYYMENHHQPIVERKTFELVQIIRSLKDKNKGAMQYPYHKRILCPFCGRWLIRHSTNEHGHPAVWHCSGNISARDEESRCQSFYIYERSISDAFMRAYNAINVELSDENLRYIKNECKEISSVEYYILDAFVESISFPSWDCMEIRWTFGEQTRVDMRYERPVDCPKNQDESWLKKRRGWADEQRFWENIYDANAYNRLCYYNRDEESM